MKARKSWKALLLLSILVIGALATVLAYSFAGLGNQANPSTSPSINPNLSSSNPTPSTPIKIVDKNIPAGYTMGFPVDGGLTNGMNVVFIQNPTDKISIRFTAKLSGTVDTLIIYAFAFEGQPVLRISLQADNNGIPSGQLLTEGAFGSTQISNSSGFKMVQLQTSASITQGKVYHIVVEPTAESNGTVAVETFQANGAGQPFNINDPDIVWSDTRINTLSNNGQGWQEQNKWPIFVVTYSDGRLEGQPYSLLAQWVVWGSTYVGQTLIPASDYKLGKMAFDISLSPDGGTPQDKLYYQIKDASNSILAQGVFAQTGQISTSQAWIEVALSSSVTLKAGQLYRISISSPQTTLDKAYYLFGYEFSYDQTIGYGGLQHQLTSSLDGGASWGDNPDADAVFKLTTLG